MLSLILLLAARGISQPSLAETRLAIPEAEFPIGYSDLRSLRELPGNKAIVFDRCDPLLRLISFSTGRDTAIGRNGSGPTEYRSVDLLLPIPGDSSIVRDYRSRRFLVIDPGGNPVRVVASPRDVMVRSSRGYIGSSFAPTGHDSLGRLYARGSAVSVGAQGFVRADSAAIERWDHRSSRRDTVAFVEILRGGEPIVPLAPLKPYAPAVSWAVSPEGRIALVHPEEYRVEFIEPSGRTFRGEPNRFDRVRLSEAHKDQWRKTVEGSCPRLIPSVPEGSGPIMRAPISNDWPNEIPPFLADAAVFDPNGVLWVRRQLEAEAPPTYDLIDRRGKVFHRVLLANGGRLLGFGKGVVYTVRLDKDDLQYIQRYKFGLLP